MIKITNEVDGKKYELVCLRGIWKEVKDEDLG
jgi:hypothetical protein